MSLESAKTQQPIFHEITTEEEARKFIMEMVEILESTRDDCNVTIPTDPQLSAKLQRKAWSNWMIRYGQALGSLTTLMHCRKLNDVAYNELRERVMRTAVPTQVGLV